MGMIKNILMVIGAVVILGMITLFAKFDLLKMDSGALGAYMSMANKVLTTGDPAKGMILKKELIIPEGTDKAEAIETAIEVMDEVGEEYGLMKVDEKTMPRAGKFMKDGGKYTHIRAYCSPTIADKFLNHSGEFVGFMPCRIGIVEDNDGKIWLYTMSLDLMIHGGHKLPEALLELANEVRDGMYAMLEKGATANVE
jgi:hypothetical protein